MRDVSGQEIVGVGPDCRSEDRQILVLGLRKLGNDLEGSLEFRESVDMCLLREIPTRFLYGIRR